MGPDRVEFQHGQRLAAASNFFIQYAMQRLTATSSSSVAFMVKVMNTCYKFHVVQERCGLDHGSY